MSAAPTISRAQADAARRVLVINVTRIGDTLLATPALRGISQFFPQARLTCLGHPKRVEVVQHLPYLAKVGGITKRHALYRGWGDVLRGHEYDWAFVWGEDAALVRYALRKARHVVAARQRDAALNAKLFAAVDLPHRPDVHAVPGHWRCRRRWGFRCGTTGWITSSPQPKPRPPARACGRTV